jgi:hypothetical protein
MMMMMMMITIMICYLYTDSTGTRPLQMQHSVDTGSHLKDKLEPSNIDIEKVNTPKQI